MPQAFSSADRDANELANLIAQRREVPYALGGGREPLDPIAYLSDRAPAHFARAGDWRALVRPPTHSASQHHLAFPWRPATFDWPIEHTCPPPPPVPPPVVSPTIAPPRLCALPPAAHRERHDALFLLAGFVLGALAMLCGSEHGLRRARELLEELRKRSPYRD